MTKDFLRSILSGHLGGQPPGDPRIRLDKMGRCSGWVALN